VRVKLEQPGSGRIVAVAAERADSWRARGYRDVSETPAAADISDMTKAELLDEAARREVDVASSWTKAEIIEALEG
jgi:hypothetical protein